MVSVTDIGNYVDALLGEGIFSETSPFQICAIDTQTRLPYRCELWKEDGRLNIYERILMNEGMVELNGYTLKRTQGGWKVDWRGLKPCPEVRQDKERELEETYDRILTVLVLLQQEIGLPSTRLIEGK